MVLHVALMSLFDRMDLSVYGTAAPIHPCQSVLFIELDHLGATLLCYSTESQLRTIYVSHKAISGLQPGLARLD